MLGRAFALPRAQAPLGFAVRGGAAGEQLERVAAQVLERRALGAREDQLHAIASGEVRELAELHAASEVLELRRRALLVQREFGERLAAALPPRHADQTQVLEQRVHPRSGYRPQSLRRGPPRFVTAVSRHARGNRASRPLHAQNETWLSPASRTRGP